MDWGQPAPLLPSFPPFLTGDKSPAGEISTGCLAVATVATRRSQRSQRSQPAGCDRCDRSDQGGRWWLTAAAAGYSFERTHTIISSSFYNPRRGAYLAVVLQW
eukprot:scaffold11207_cov78-Skeletonema_menzelii.AAC.1